MARPYHFRDGWVLVLGDRYDLDKTLAAAESVIDCLAQHLAVGISTATIEFIGYRRSLVWDGSAKKLVREFWSRSAAKYDVADIAVAHKLGPLTAKVYLLGKTWCVYDEAGGSLTTPDGLPPSELDPVPTICLYGPEVGPENYSLLPPDVVDAAEAALRSDLGGLGLQMERHVLMPGPTRTSDRSQIAFITLPPDVFGVGRGPIRVRCVTPDGAEVRPTPAV